MVGPGTNRWALIAAEDAAAAALTAANLGGTLTAAERDVPTQRELVEHLCVVGKTPIPDHVPQVLAGFSLGAPLAAALAADVPARTSEALAAAGWQPVRSWRKDLLGLTRTEEAPGEE